MPGRTLIWLLTLPLAIVSSQLAHALAYRLVEPRPDVLAHDLAATGHAYLEYATLGVTACVVVVAAVLACEVRRLMAPGARPGRASATWFALIAPAIFIGQEHLERLVHGGAFPWEAAFERSFAIGLFLQLPAAAVAYVLARLLIRIARSVGRALGAARPARVHTTEQRPTGRASVLTIAALASGRASRAPPLVIA